MFELRFPLPNALVVSMQFEKPPTKEDFEVLQEYMRVVVDTFSYTFKEPINDFHNEYRSDPPTHRKKDGNL